MKINKWKINLLLTFITLVIALIIVNIDSKSLNSLLINDSEEEFIINEVNTYKEEKVITSSPTLIKNNVANNKWNLPISGNYTITTYYSYGHKAIDYAGNYGSNILAANNGTVLTVGTGCVKGNIECNGRRGNYIVINHHNNYYTVYMHLAEIKVNEGDNVSAGQVIATMGNTGQVIPVPTDSNPYGGTHLHFCVFIGEPYKNGYAIDPLTLY